MFVIQRKFQRTSKFRIHTKIHSQTNPLIKLQTVSIQITHGCFPVKLQQVFIHRLHKALNVVMSCKKHAISKCLYISLDYRVITSAKPRKEKMLFSTFAQQSVDLSGDCMSCSCQIEFKRLTGR